jgi:hypothetical protein
MSHRAVKQFIAIPPYLIDFIEDLIIGMALAGAFMSNVARKQHFWPCQVDNLWITHGFRACSCG